MEDQQLRTDVELLKRDMHQLNGLFSRLDTTIEKLGEVSANISKIIAVHEQKIVQQEDADKQLQSLVDVLFDKLEDRRRESEIAKEEFRREMSHLHGDIMTEMKEMKEAQTRYQSHLLDRVTALEKWKWMVVGGAILFGYILSLAQKFI